jgi:hypothetical protein
MISIHSDGSTQKNEDFRVFHRVFLGLSTGSNWGPQPSISSPWISFPRIYSRRIYTRRILVSVAAQDIDWSAVGRRLTEVRGATTQVEFGSQLGVPQNFVSRYENAKAKPSPKYLAAVAGLTGVTLDWLLLGREPKYARVGPE